MAFYRNLLNKLGKGPFHTAVIVAAGSSQRMGQDKLAMVVGGMTVLERTLHAFQDCETVHEIVVVTRADRMEDIAALRELCGITQMTKVVEGGSTRVGSSLAGVMAADKRATLIGIHDAARPLITPALITAVYETAQQCQAAAPTLPLKDTVKEIKDGLLIRTPPREGLAAVQTPQVFQADLIRGALLSATEQKLPITDDCSAVEAMGLAVTAVEGSEENIKITTPLDVALAEEIIRRRG